MKNWFRIYILSFLFLSGCADPYYTVIRGPLGEAEIPTNWLNCCSGVGCTPGIGIEYKTSQAGSCASVSRSYERLGDLEKVNYYLKQGCQLNKYESCVELLEFGKKHREYLEDVRDILVSKYARKERIVSNHSWEEMDYELKYYLGYSYMYDEPVNTELAATFLFSSCKEGNTSACIEWEKVSKADPHTVMEFIEKADQIQNRRDRHLQKMENMQMKYDNAEAERIDQYTKERKEREQANDEKLQQFIRDLPNQVIKAPVPTINPTVTPSKVNVNVNVSSEPKHNNKRNVSPPLTVKDESNGNDVFMHSKCLDIWDQWAGVCCKKFDKSSDCNKGGPCTKVDLKALYEKYDQANRRSSAAPACSDDF